MEPIHLILPISLFTFITFVFLSKNPVYGVLSFVVIVVHIVILLILLDLEFLAYILAIVYIGAIVVLFLFVIMMFYIYNFSTKRAYFRGLFEYFILGCLIGNVAYCIAFAREDKYLDYATVVFNDNLITLFAWYLYNDGLLLIIIITLIMLVGIIGAIILTVKSAAVEKPQVIRVRSTLNEVLLNIK